MWNWEFEVSDEGKAHRERVWEEWASVNRWPKWDADLEWCNLDGNFEQGAKGTLKPKDWKPIPFTLSEVVLNKKFTVTTVMPIGTICEFDHIMEALPSGLLRITHSVKTRGLLAPILRFTLKRSLKKGLPNAIKRLFEIAGGKTI